MGVAVEGHPPRCERRDRRQEPHHRAGQPAVDRAVAAQGRRGDQPVGRLGVVAGEVLDARAEGAEGLRHQQRVAGAQRPAQPGGAVGERGQHEVAVGQGLAARERDGGVDRVLRARSEPVTFCRHGRGVHRGVRSGHGRSGERVVGVRCHQASLAAGAPGRVPSDLLGLALAQCSRSPGVLGGALRPPRQPRLAGGVDRGEQQAAEQAEVLQEVRGLGGALGRVLLLPEGVPRVGRRNEGRGEDERRTGGGGGPGRTACPRRPSRRRWRGPAARGRPGAAAARRERGSPVPRSRRAPPGAAASQGPP